jgi:hypothetical protein
VAQFKSFKLTKRGLFRAFGDDHPRGRVKINLRAGDDLPLAPLAGAASGSGRSARMAPAYRCLRGNATARRAHTGHDVAAHVGEMRVNVGGEPDRDDFGLPPVDIEIPDDARDLDRDVQAYHRELRALRRQMRFGRLRAPLTRDGLVLPLLAGCLAMVLISGVLLTVFTAGQSGAPQPTPSQPANASTSQATPKTQPAGQRVAALPAAAVRISGKTALASSVLALVPAGCRCRAALRKLRMQATAAGVTLYVVGAKGDMPQARRLAAHVGLPPGRVAEDTKGVLTAEYAPHGLTALLVSGDGSVAPVVRARGSAPLLTRQLRSVAPAAA